jgi:hypothetical protein
VIVRALREELTSGDPKTTKLLIDLLRQAVREELTSGDANTKKLLADLLLSIVLKNSMIKLPTDVQDHWQESVALAASAARTSSGNTADIDIGRFLYGVVTLDVTAVSGTTPTLDVYVEYKDQVSGKYIPIWSQTGISAVGTWTSDILTLPHKYVRVRWVIGGTSPSFTFSVGMEGKS